ncbi:hypothetical protein [uncultured Prevotella sp.]|uniref:hypothetical protein n=1 Tax=uncultured Prevotella sp. TaxID=159272 RepID=UPI002582FEB7|nr:hypothetical protein [uncultured Prevotella sp.]
MLRQVCRFCATERECTHEKNDTLGGRQLPKRELLASLLCFGRIFMAFAWCSNGFRVVCVLFIGCYISVKPNCGHRIALLTFLHNHLATNALQRCGNKWGICIETHYNGVATNGEYV